MARVTRCFRTLLCVHLLAGGLVGCTEDTNFLNLWGSDGGATTTDAAGQPLDVDAGGGGTGSGNDAAVAGEKDSGTLTMDAAVIPMDSSAPTLDTGPVVVPDDDSGL